MLTDKQHSEFFEQGFTRISHALPSVIVDAMQSRIWQALKEIHSIEKADPNTWIEGGIRGIGKVNREPEFRPFGTPEIDLIIDNLLGKDQWQKPVGWGQVLVTFPAQQWDWNSLFQGQVEVKEIQWHTDYPYDTPPDELAGVQIFCLLADIEPGGGGTLIVAGSHRLIHNFVKTESPETIEKMKRARLALIKNHPWLQAISIAKSLSRPEAWMAEQQTTIDTIPVKVTELTGKAGDMYLTHPWLLHAPSPNCNTTPRIMCTQRIHRISAIG